MLQLEASFSDAGYQARILAARPAWLNDARVERIASASTCTSGDPAERWPRNVHGWFDTADAARAACPRLARPAVIHGYRLLDVAWDDGSAHRSTLPRSSASPIPPGWILLGHDVASRDLTESFECSPLSCNHRSVDFPINADCLLPDLASAMAAAKDFSRGHNAEPGTYYVVEVWSEPSGGA
jgi:hypothetical protein